MNARAALLVALAAFAVLFAVLWARTLRARRSADEARGAPSLRENAIGFVTNFFDTLGIGSFATTTAIFRALRAVPDRLVPGTLNVGHTMPTFAQALIYVAIVEVEIPTLIAMIAASMAGALLGAGVVAGWSTRNVRVGMGCALLAAAALIVARLLGLLPPGGDARGLHGAWLLAGVVGNFALGALMTIGIGLYAPCMILVALLGMDPRVAFPIMMGSCAFLMPVASVRFVQRGSYAPRAALGLALGGVPAVLLAAYFVRELPLDAVRWLVVGVVVYTAVAMLSAARRGDSEPDRVRPAA
jgi:uncharacterized membrane protein YfcA